MVKGLETYLGEGIGQLERFARFNYDLIDRLPVGLAVTAWSGRIAYANQKFCRLFDLAAEDIQRGSDVQEFLPVETFKKLASEAALLGAAKDDNVDVNFNGRPRTFRLSIIGLRDSQDTCAMAVVLEALEVFVDEVPNPSSPVPKT